MTAAFRRTLIVWLGVLFACTQVWAQAPSGRQGIDVFNKVSIEQRLGEQVPLDLKFFDETGREVTLRELIDGKPVLLNLVYYECPMLCNLTMDGLVRSVNNVTLDAGKDYTILTVSIDPSETPALAAQAKRSAIKRYSRSGAADGWHFLTGREESIRKLADAVGFEYAYDPARDEFAHAAGIMVLTPQGVVSKYFFGIEFPPRDVRLGLVEASSGKVGSLADRVLLLCYHYDPATGKYGFAIFAVLRTLGVATVAAMGVGIGLMLLRDRRIAAKNVDRAADSTDEDARETL